MINLFVCIPSPTINEFLLSSRWLFVINNVNNSNRPFCQVFLVEFAALAITCHNLHLIHFGKFVDFTEFHFVQHQCPNIVAETIGVQFAGFECNTSLDTLTEGIVDAFVKLQQDLKCQCGCNLSILKVRQIGLNQWPIPKDNNQNRFMCRPQAEKISQIQSIIAYA